MGRVIRFSLLCFVTMALLYPVLLMFSGGFTPRIGFLTPPPKLVPYAVTLSNYRQVFRLHLLTRWLFNSVLVAASLVVGGTTLAALAGYAFHVWRTRLSRVLFWLLLAPIFVTRITVLIPQFVIINRLHLNGLPAVILIPLFWPVGIFFFRNYFSAVPSDFIESARLDGAREWFILAKVMLPLSRPILGVSFVMLGLGALGDYIWQMLNLKHGSAQTLLVGLVNTTIDVTVVNNIGYDLAVATLLFIPYVIIFASASHYFVGGLTVGGLKE